MEENRISDMRRDAEAAVRMQEIDVSALSKFEIQAIVHDLEVHRIELEMQNEELQNANAELAQSRRTYSDLFEFAPVGYLILDHEYIMTNANLTASQLLGRTRDQLLSTAFTTLLHPDCQNAFHFAVSRALRDHERQQLDLRLLSSENQPLWMHAEILSRDTGDTYLLSLNDITRQKEAEQRLKASEEKFRDLFNVMVDPLYLHDFEGHFMEVNASACETLGYSWWELLRLGVADIAADFSYGQLHDAIDTMQRTGEALFEGVHRTRQGREFPVEIHSKLIDFQGQQAVLSVARDISRRKAAEQRYELLSNVTFEGILVHQNAIAVDANASISRLTGYSREEVIGKNLLEFIATPEDRERAAQNMTRRATAPYVVRARRKDGSLFDAELEARNIEYQGETLRIVAVRDVTERHRTRLALHERMKELKGLYRVSEIILEQADEPIPSVLRQIVSVIPPAWHYPELCYASIAWDGYQVATPNATESDWQLRANIRVFGQNVGLLTVGYARRPPLEGADPVFLDEEVDLIRAMAERIGTVLERRQAEEALKASQAANQRLADASFEAIFFSERGICTNQNRAAERMFGYTLEEAVGRPAAKWIHPEYRDMVRQNMREHATGPYEAVALRKDGSTFPCEIQAKIAAHGDTIVRITALRDITDRKRSEQALRESEEKFRSIVENVNDIIYAVTPDGTFTYVSPNWKAMLGHEPAEVVGRNFAEFVHPDDVHLCAEFLQTVLTSGQKQSGVEYRVRHLDGTWRWHLSNGSPIQDADQNTVSYIGVARDVTDRKRREEMMQHRLLYEKSLAAFSSALLEDQPDAIDQALRAILPCTAASRIYVFENFSDPVDGLCMKQTHEVCLDGVEPQIRNPALQHLVYAADGFGRWSERLRQNDIVHGRIRDFPPSEQAILRPQAILSILVIPVWVNQKWFGFIGFDDTTREREWHEEDVRLLRTVAQILGTYLERRRDRETIRAALSEKDVLLKEIHHRVKNNMQTIAGLLYKQQQHTADPPTRAVLQDSIQRVKSMAAIHEQIYRSKNLARVNMADYIDNFSRRLVKTYRPQGSAVRVTVDVDDVYLSVDKSIPVALILNELLMNALKYAFPGHDNGRIDIICRLQAGTITLCVRDNGVGLPDGLDITRVETLGLYLVYNLATKQLGGSVLVQRANPTEFTVTFPMQRETV